MGRKKTKQQAVRDHLQRPESHVTDERARRHLANSTPPEWVSNPLTGDYGKDYHIELTRDGGRVDRAFYVQLKGTRHCKYTDGGAAVSFPLERRYLAHYAGEVKLPVFLVVVDVAAGRGFWLFAQQHLAENPGWDAGASSTLRIPTANRLEDPAAFAQAVTRAMAWMVEAQQKPVRERASELIRRLEAKDPRYRVEASFGANEERLRLIAREPVSLRFHVRPKKKKLLAAMKADFLDRGLPVAFQPGELAVEGSALFEELVAGGGTFQLAYRGECQLALALYDDRGAPVEEWAGIPAEIVGGQKEFRVRTTISRSPVEVTVGPLGAAAGGPLNVSADPIHWAGQPLLAASYFDRIDSFLSNLVRSPLVGVRCEAEGNQVFEGRARLDRPEAFEPFAAFVRVMRQAREVARHFGISPTCTRTNLVGDALRDIEIAHALMTAGRYEYEEEAGDWRVDITFDKRVAAEFVAGERVLRDAVLYLDEGTRLPFMDQSLAFDRLGWELTEAAVYTPHEELVRRLAAPGEGVLVSFRTTPNTRRALRLLDAEELSAVGSGAAQAAAVRVRKPGAK